MSSYLLFSRNYVEYYGLRRIWCFHQIRLPRGAVRIFYPTWLRTYNDSKLYLSVHELNITKDCLSLGWRAAGPIGLYYYENCKGHINVVSHHDDVCVVRDSKYRWICSFGNTQFKSIVRKEHCYVLQTSLFLMNPTYATILNSIVFLL